MTENRKPADALTREASGLRGACSRFPAGVGARKAGAGSTLQMLPRHGPLPAPPAAPPEPEPRQVGAPASGRLTAPPPAAPPEPEPRQVGAPASGRLTAPPPAAPPEPEPRQVGAPASGRLTAPPPAAPPEPEPRQVEAPASGRLTAPPPAAPPEPEPRQVGSAGLWPAYGPPACCAARARTPSGRSAGLRRLTAPPPAAPPEPEPRQVGAPASAGLRRPRLLRRPSQNPVRSERRPLPAYGAPACCAARARTPSGRSAGLRRLTAPPPLAAAEADPRQARDPGSPVTPNPKTPGKMALRAEKPRKCAEMCGKKIKK